MAYCSRQKRIRGEAGKNQNLLSVGIDSNEALYFSHSNNKLDNFSSNQASANIHPNLERQCKQSRSKFKVAFFH